MKALFPLVGRCGGRRARGRVSRSIVVWSAAAWFAAGTAWGANLSWNNDFGNWNTPGNWSPAGPPDPIDAVFIGNLVIAENGFVTLNVDATIGALSITDGMALNMNGHTLLVNGDVAVSGQNEVNDVIWSSRIQVRKSGNSDDLDVNNLTVTNGAGVELWDGGILEVDNVYQMAAGTRLYGAGVVDFEGNEARVFINDGTIQAAPGALILNQNGSGRIDLDGNAGNGAIHVATYSNITMEYSTLTINGDQLADAFSGTLTIGGGFVNMNLSGGWTADANSELVFFGDSVDTAKLNGSQATIAGLVSVWGTAEINAPSVWSASATALIDNNNELRLDGAAVFSGAAFQQVDGDSGGVVTNNGGVTVASDTTIDLPTGVFDMDGNGETSNTTLQNGVTLALNVATIDNEPAGGPFDGTLYLNEGSTLAVNTAAAWSNSGAINIEGGLLTGSGLVNQQLIAGHGRLEPASLVNDGVLAGVAGTLKVHAAGAADLDGMGQAGTLSATAGSLTIEGVNKLQEFFGDVQVGFLGAFQSFWMPTGGLENRGLIALSGGEYRAGLVQNGDLTVDFKSRIVTNGRFGADGVNAIDATLELEGAFDLEAGAVFNGSGEVEVLSDSTLRAEDGATVAVHLDNFGIVAPGEVPGDETGILHAARYTNEEKGRLAIDIFSAGGVPGADHDLLDVRGTATLLGGTLEASFLEGFTPSLGDEFLVVRTLLGVDGKFDQLAQPPLPNVKLSVIYDDFTVRLVAVAVPEPSPAVLVICGIFAGWRGSRQRRLASLQK